MLAYRHAFHAGNHADVLKHIVWVRLLRHLNLKDKGYRVIDTHAGAGEYALDSAEALKNGEFRDGIARLWSRDDLPPAAADYVQLVRRLNPAGALVAYPGSPLIAAWILRPQDELRLFERHPADFAALAERFAPARRSPVDESAAAAVPAAPLHRAVVKRDDGFTALKAQLPPPTRRALVLIDPSYEGRADYAHVVDAVRDALARFAPAVLMVWAPQVVKPGAAGMLRELRTLAGGRWLQAALKVRPPDAAGFGLLGSTVFVINPPHTLGAELRSLLPWLATVLAQFDGAGWRLDGPGAPSVTDTARTQRCR